MTTYGDPAASGAPLDRGAAWIELLVELTDRRGDWLSWKGYRSALEGPGDVDSVAPAQAWPTIREVVGEWAVRHGLGPVVVCPHAPGLLHIVALPPTDDPYFELDVNRRKVFLGSTLFRPSQLEPMTVMDDLGVRRLRPGAEGVMKLVQNGMRRGARVRWDQMEKKGIVELLAADPEGVVQAASLFGRASGALVRGARSVARGHWDRAAMIAVELWCVARAAVEPDAVLWRLRFRWHRHRCPVLQSVFDGGRRVPLDTRRAWLDAVAAYGGHDISGTGGGS
jgi:hypothetical protein